MEKDGKCDRERTDVRQYSLCLVEGGIGTKKVGESVVCVSIKKSGGMYGSTEVQKDLMDTINFLVCSYR